MMYGYYGSGMGWWIVVSSVFWLALVGVAVWALVRWVSHQTRTGQSSPVGSPGTAPSAEEILRQRYARGEIDATTYEQMRAHLAATAQQRPPVGTP